MNPSIAPSRWRRLAAWICAAAALVCSACATPVRPWQKGSLARPEMRFEHDALDAMFAEHIYSSKEAAAGGNGVGGGGCGCN